MCDLTKTHVLVFLSCVHDKCVAHLLNIYVIYSTNVLEVLQPDCS